MEKQFCLSTQAVDRLKSKNERGPRVSFVTKKPRTYLASKIHSFETGRRDENFPSKTVKSIYKPLNVGYSQGNKLGKLRPRFNARMSLTMI